MDQTGHARGERVHGIHCGRIGIGAGGQPQAGSDPVAVERPEHDLPPQPGEHRGQARRSRPWPSGNDQPETRVRSKIGNLGQTRIPKQMRVVHQQQTRIRGNAPTVPDSAGDLGEPVEQRGLAVATGRDHGKPDGTSPARRDVSAQPPSRLVEDQFTRVQVTRDHTPPPPRRARGIR